MRVFKVVGIMAGVILVFYLISGLGNVFFHPLKPDDHIPPALKDQDALLDESIATDPSPEELEYCLRAREFYTGNSDYNMSETCLKMVTFYELEYFGTPGEDIEFEDGELYIY